MYRLSGNIHKKGTFYFTFLVVTLSHGSGGGSSDPPQDMLALQRTVLTNVQAGAEGAEPPRPSPRDWTGLWVEVTSHCPEGPWEEPHTGSVAWAVSRGCSTVFGGSESVASEPLCVRCPCRGCASAVHCSSCPRGSEYFFKSVEWVRGHLPRWFSARETRTLFDKALLYS